MGNTELLDLIKKLPADKKKAVEEFVSNLTSEPEAITYIPNQLKNTADKKPKLKREFGGLKGFVTYMADDFDAPLDDFKDYI